MEVPYEKSEDGEEMIHGHAVIDLRDMYTKTQIDVLSKLGSVGWNALFEIARNLGASDIRVLVAGRSVEKLSEPVRAAMPQPNESAPAISIQIENA